MSMSVEMILRLIDQATGPLRGVEAGLDKLKSQTDKINAAQASGGRVKASVWWEQQQQIKGATEALKAQEAQINRVNAAAHAAAYGYAAAESKKFGDAILHRAYSAGAAGAHAEAALETQGNSLRDVEEIQRVAAEYSRRYRAFSQTQIENMLGDAQTFVGSLEHATAVLPELLQLRAIQQGLHGHSSDRDFGYLAKALEQGGVANDPAKVHQRMETFARWMEVYRETFSVDAINQFYQGLKGPIARTLDEDFLRGAAGHFIQELGGHATGNALSQMYMGIVASRAQPRALVALDEIGLLDEKKITRGGPFGIRKADPGAVTGSNLFTHNPDRWVREVLGPALDRVKDPTRREEIESALFSDATARNIADKLLHQQAIIAKDAGFISRAPGLRAWETWQNKDPAMAATAAGSQFENLMRDAGKPYMPHISRFMNWFAQLEAKAGEWAEKHPGGSAGAAGAAVLGLWGASGALARAALIKGGEAWAEGMAKASTGVATEGAAGGLLGGLFKTAGKGILTGALYAGGRSLLDTLEEKAFGWTDANKAEGEAKINREAHRWWRSHGVNMPWWEKERPAPPPIFTQSQPHGPFEMNFGGGRALPTFAAAQTQTGSSPATPSATGGINPQVNASGIKQAADEADRLTAALGSAANISLSPHVDSGELAKADTLAKSLLQTLNAIGGAAGRAASAATRAGASMHVLNDGAEVH